MKQLSQEVISVLRRSKDEESFANEVVKHPEQALHLYALTPQDVDYIKSFKSKEELQLGFEQYMEAQQVGKVSNQSLMMRGLPALIFLLLLVAYILLSHYFPDFITSLGLPVWEKIHTGIRFVLGIYGIGALLFFFIILNQRLEQMGPNARVAVLIGLVTFVFIPGSILFVNLALTTQVTLIQVLLTLIFTILPASLYSLFIMTRGRSLWNEFVVNLAQLDPVGYKKLIPIYQKKFSALYGSPDESGFGSALLQGEASFPVLFATFIIGLGWLLFFFTELPGGVDMVNITDLSKGQLLERTIEFLFSGFVAPFTFGFLGAYLFSLNMLFRRYVQSDLKSVAYTHISQRILLTWVWAFLLSVLPWDQLKVTGLDDPYRRIVFTSVLAFVVGIFPEIAWQVVSQFIRGVLSIVLPSFKENYPLNKIEGVTIWVEARLMEEDIENVENLITTGIVDLMLRTNLKPERIVHWIDQGVLILHLGPENNNLLRRQKNPLQQAFIEHGIITATDLMIAYKAATRIPHDGKPRIFLSEELDPRVRDLVASIEDDPNMYHVYAWREMNAERRVRLPQAVKAQIDRKAPPPTLSRSAAAPHLPHPTQVKQTATLPQPSLNAQITPPTPTEVEANLPEDDLLPDPEVERPLDIESVLE